MSYTCLVQYSISYPKRDLPIIFFFSSPLEPKYKYIDNFISTMQSCGFLIQYIRYDVLAYLIAWQYLVLQKKTLVETGVYSCF